MKTITKRADELKSGDIIVAKGTGRRSVVLSTFKYNDLISVLSVDIGDEFEIARITSPSSPEPCDRLFMVELRDSLDISAEEFGALLAAGRFALKMVPVLTDAEYDLTRAVVDRHLIPPTAQELAQALSKVDPMHIPPSVNCVLERARKAGLV